MTFQVSSDEPSHATFEQSPLDHTGSDADTAARMQVKVCPRCSVQSQTAGSFCPHCAAPYGGHKPRRKVSKRIVIAVVAALVVIGSATGLALKVSHDNQVTAQRVAAANAAQADAAAAAATVAAKQATDDKTRADRKAMVTQLEASILKDAKDRVTSQTLTGPILSASCTPLGGGSADDLTALSGTFECIAVNLQNADGSSSGYRFAAAINWSDGSYTWHLGS